MRLSAINRRRDTAGPSGPKVDVRRVQVLNVSDSGCRTLADSDSVPSPRLRYSISGMETIRTAYEDVYVYAMGRPGFILQHVVDGTVVQTATADTKPIAIVFGLVGLYLHVERQFSGKQVQRAHKRLAEMNRDWPNLSLTDRRGAMTAADVLAANEGPERDLAIEDWCRSVWAACVSHRETIVGLCREGQLV